MLRFSLLVILLFSICILNGQDDNSGGKRVRIETTQGDVLEGTLLESTDEEIVLRTSFGETKVKNSSLKSLEYLDSQSNDADGDSNNYSASHYLFNQSGYDLNKGQIYYENIALFGNTFGFGVSDNFSVVTGFEAISLFAPAFPVFFVSPKYSIPFRGGAVSISAPHFLGSIDGEFLSIAGLQSALTFGSHKNNLTVGYGIVIPYQYLGDPALHLFQLSGITKLGGRVSLISENYLTSIDGFVELIFTAGVRIHSKKNNNFITLSIIRPSADIDIIGIPFFSATVAIK